MNFPAISSAFYSGIVMKISSGTVCSEIIQAFPRVVFFRFSPEIPTGSVFFEIPWQLI